MIHVEFNGVDLGVADFPRTLEGWVAYRLATMATTHCRDKDAAMELLLHDARRIIEQVKTGQAP